MSAAAGPLAIGAGAAAAIAANLLLPGTVLVYGPLKALTTALVIAWAWRRGVPADGRPMAAAEGAAAVDFPADGGRDGDAAEASRRRALLLGLGLSLAGDVALLWPQRGFLPGLAAFLLAHLAYLWAFTRGVRLARHPLPFVAYAAVAGGVLALLWPGVPAGLRAPVAGYVACLAAMAAQTACFAIAHRGHARLGAPAQRAAAGGALFVLSDALLAVDRFHAPLPLAALGVLGTYWAAQTLLASSLPRRRPGPRSASH